MPFPSLLLFLILGLCFSQSFARILIPPNPWQDFEKFTDLEKGSSHPGISNLKNYFRRFGYLSDTSSISDQNLFDEPLQSALLSYQKNLGLPITGKLDSSTLHLITSPRCGVHDNHNEIKSDKLTTTKRYAYFSGKPRWSTKSTPITLTYAISPDHTIDYITGTDIRAAFIRSFARWSAVIPVSFIESPEYTAAEIKIGFYGGDHGDGEPFDGVLGILAHAFSPENGRLHLDTAERWAVDFGTEDSKVAVDLESVVTHEIGHVLGLAHSGVKESIMYPSLSPRKRKRDLRVDDVAGVQALYGSNPDFSYSSLLASEETSGGGGGGRRRFCWWMLFSLVVVLL